MEGVGKGFDLWSHLERYCDKPPKESMGCSAVDGLYPTTIKPAITMKPATKCPSSTLKVPWPTNSNKKCVKLLALIALRKNIHTLTSRIISYNITEVRWQIFETHWEATTILRWHRCITLEVLQNCMPHLSITAVNGAVHATLCIFYQVLWTREPCCQTYK